jgi:uncharacterized protein (TIGR02246 family)
VKDRQKLIEEVVKKWVYGYNKHRPDYLADLYTDTADFISVLGEHWSGDEIRVKFRQLHSTFLKNTVIETRGVRIKLVADEIAVVHHSWRVVNGSGENNSYTGLLTHVLRLDRGVWRIESSHNSTLQEVSGRGEPADDTARS